MPDNINVPIKPYLEHLKNLHPTQRQAAYEEILQQVTFFSVLAETEIKKEQANFGTTLYHHLIEKKLAIQIDGAVHLTPRGKELLFILAYYLDPTYPAN